MRCTTARNDQRPGARVHQLACTHGADVTVPTLPKCALTRKPRTTPATRRMLYWLHSAAARARTTARARIESHDATFPSTLSRRPAIIPVKLDLRASSIGRALELGVPLRWHSLQHCALICGGRSCERCGHPRPTRSTATFCTVLRLEMRVLASLSTTP